MHIQSTMHGQTLSSLYAQLGSLDMAQSLLIRLQSGLNPISDKPIDLLGCPTDESLGIHQLIQLTPDRLKVGILLNPLDQIILSSLLLDYSSSLVGENTDLFVTFLPISSGFDHGHDDVFGSHEWKFLGDTTGNDGWVNYHSFTDVLERCKEDVGSEEGFGEGYSSVRTACQLPFRNVDGKRAYLSSRVRSSHWTEAVIKVFW